VVDVASTLDTKVESFLCHSSQVQMLAAWFLRGPTSPAIPADAGDPDTSDTSQGPALRAGARRYLETMARTAAKLAPREAGVELGEAFYALDVSPGHFGSFQEMFDETAGGDAGKVRVVG